jgi:hypothetical protein
MPPLLGLSIQLASSGSLLGRLHATKSARRLAHELHIHFALAWDLATRSGPSSAPFRYGAGNFTNSSEEK